MQVPDRDIGICGLCPSMSSGSCILLVCTLPSLLWSVSTSVFYYSRECHVNIHVNSLVPPGIVATQESSGPYSLLIWVWMLPEEGHWNILISCPSHLSRLTLAAVDSCSPHKGGLMPSTGLNPFECPSEKCPWSLLPTSFILQLLQGTQFLALSYQGWMRALLAKDSFGWVDFRHTEAESIGHSSARGKKACWHQAWTTQIPSPSPHSSYHSLFCSSPSLAF